MKNNIQIDRILFGAFLFFAVILRFSRLNSFPVFGDEALYLFLADEINKNPTLLMDSLNYHVFPVVIWFIAGAQLLFHGFLGPVIYGRGLMVVTDLISAYLVYLIAKFIFSSKKVAALSLVFYLSIPFNFLHSRLAILESITNFLSLIIIYFSIKAAYKNLLQSKVNYFWIIQISAVLVLSFFAKPLSVVSYSAALILPFIEIIRRTNLQKLKFLFINFFLAFALGGLIIFALFLPVAKEFSNHYIANNGSSLSAAIKHFKTNIWRVIWWTKDYFTWTVIFLFFVGTVVAVFKKNAGALWLLIWIVTIIFLECFFSSNFYPRHLYPLVAPVALLCGYILSKVWKFKPPLGFIIAVACLYPGWILNMKIVFDPLHAPIALEDRQQFFEDWTAGVGYQQIAQKLEVFSENQQISVYMENVPHQYWLFTNLYKIKNAKIYSSDELAEGRFIQAECSKKENTYIVLNREPVAPSSWPVKLVYSYPKGLSRTINIYRVVCY